MPREQPAASSPACVVHGSHGASRALGEVSCATAFLVVAPKPPNTQTVRCSSSITVTLPTSLDSLLYGGTRLSHVSPRLAIRRIPQSRLVHDSTLVSNVKRRPRTSKRIEPPGARLPLWGSSPISYQILVLTTYSTVQYDREREVDLAVCQQILL
jgi:hypothetical protein